MMTSLSKVRRFWLALISCCVLPTIGQPGPVSIQDAEIPALRLLVDRDRDAGKIFRGLKETADRSMSDAPNPIDLIVSEGVLASNPAKIRSRRSLGDMEKIQALAWVGIVTGMPKYTAKAREFIYAWATTNQSDGDPINETSFEPLIEAYDGLRDGFSTPHKMEVDAWLRKKAMMLWQDPRGRQGNWQSHRLKVVGLVAILLGDDALRRQVDDEYRKHIQADFQADGQSYDFKLRDAMHYHLYSVRPLLTLACASGRAKDDLFDFQAANGASLAAAVEFIVPFANGSKKHVEFANSRAKFDQKRADSGEADFQKEVWKPQLAVPVFSEAGCLDAKYDRIASSIDGDSSKRYIDWRAVLNSVAPSPRAK